MKQQQKNPGKLFNAAAGLHRCIVSPSFDKTHNIYINRIGILIPLCRSCQLYSESKNSLKSFLFLLSSAYPVDPRTVGEMRCGVGVEEHSVDSQNAVVIYIGHTSLESVPGKSAPHL